MADTQPIPVTTVTQPTAEVAAADLSYRQAYEKVLADQIAVNPAAIVPINIDVTAAYTTVIGALPKIIAFRERLTKLSEFDTKNIDNLETYALALMHAQGEYVAASAPPEALFALNEEGSALRDTLYTDALALVNRGFVNADPLKEFKNAPGYKNLGEDLVGLSSLLRKSWAQIASRTMITMDELDRAESLSKRLLHAVAMRENASVVLAEATQQRLQVFTLFIRAYNEVRRAISFLRWNEDDVDSIAPSLYAGRGRKKTEVEKPALTVAPASPSPTGVAAPGTAANPGAATQPGTAPIAGIPQGDPFAPKAN